MKKSCGLVIAMVFLTYCFLIFLFICFSYFLNLVSHSWALFLALFLSNPIYSCMGQHARHLCTSTDGAVINATACFSFAQPRNSA